MFRTVFFIVFLFFMNINWAQSPMKVIVEEVEMVGNKKTKSYIFYRELDIQKGDTILFAQLETRLQENKQRLLSTSLCNYVTANITSWDIETNKITIQFAITEAWYIYPSMIFELEDRNFNVWWTEHNRSLSRINYGVRIDHINLTGNKDYIKLKLQFGYTPKYELRYQFPYLNEKQTWGLAAEIFYATNKEVAFQTINNKTQFFSSDDDKILYRRFRTGVNTFYRPNLYWYHELGLKYYGRKVSDQLIAENPFFFPQGNRQNYLGINYQLRLDKRGFRLYPENGYHLVFEFDQQGIGVFDTYSRTSFSALGSYYLPLSESYSLVNHLKIRKVFSSEQQAYTHNRALGYGKDYIRGYELYVQDGTDYVYNKMQLRWKFVDRLFKLDRHMPLKQFKLFPFKAYFRTHFEIGNVKESFFLEENPQNNHWLMGYGLALDMILYNNFLFQIEYNFNDRSDRGLYLIADFSF